MSADLQPVTDSALDGLTSKYSRLSETDIHLILVMAADNRTQTDIAAAVGCSQSAVSNFLKRVSQPASVVQKLLKAKELKAADLWERAAEKAAERGDHRPARELIETANPELRPQQGNSAGGGGVTIIIGTPDSPLRPPSITIETAPVSPLQIAAPGEGPQNR